MSHRLLPAACLSLLIALITFVYLQRAEKSALADQLTSTNQLSTSAKPAVEATLPTPSGEQSPIATSHPQANTENIWSIVVIESLNAEYPGYGKAIDHISRAITFENFAALSTPQAERLIRYAQAVQASTEERILHLCWGHDTQPEVVTAFEGVRALALTAGDTRGDPLPVFYGTYRWSETATDGSTGSEGTPVTIRWGFVTDGTTVPDGGRDSNDNPTVGTSNLIAQLNSTYGAPTVANDLTTANWFPIFEDAFAAWAAVSGNTYVYEPNDDGASLLGFNDGLIGVRADVRIGGTAIDGNSGTLAFNYFPDSGDMVIDTNDTANFAIGQEDLFRNTIGHEHGHGLGLDHVCPINETKLMEPFVSEDFSGPQLDDIITIQGLYGDPLEKTSGSNNNTTASAYNFGTLNSGITHSQLSISNSNDIDLYRFQVSSTRELSVTVTPTSAAAYLEGQQNNNGSCSSGTLFDPETRQNLSIRVLAADGSTVLGSSNVSAIGQAEVLDNIQLQLINQDYFIEVTGGGENSGDANNTQLYSLDVELVDPSAVQITDFILTNESCTPANGSPDPEEFVTGYITVKNIGAEDATGITTTLSSNGSITIQGNATQNIGTLTPGQAVDITYTFALSGDCGEEINTTFRADTTTGFVEHLEVFILGVNGTVSLEDFDSTSVGQIPAGYNSDSGNAAADWETTNSASESAPNSIFSPGLNASNSSYLTTPEIEVVNDITELRFDHHYFMETNFDGGVLEISINNGVWTEWIAAGGSFSENGYNSSIASNAVTPLANEDAWTGNSTGFIHTIANFPASAIGETVRVRWHQANDGSLVRDGWWIDNIEIYGPFCCETSIPTLSVTAPSPTLEEFTPSSSADFIITSDIAVVSNVSIAYSLSGDATSGSDFVALAGTTTLPSSQSVIAIPVTAIADTQVEGDETLTLTLSPSVNYGIDTASASITIKDLPFDEYRNDNFGSSISNVAEDEDFDFDGIANLVEYGFRLDPTTSTPLPFSLMIENSGGSSLELTYYEDTNLVDVNYIVETSTTLQPNSWTTVGVSITDGATTNGLKARTASISIDSQPAFIRIRIERIIP